MADVVEFSSRKPVPENDRCGLCRHYKPDPSMMGVMGLCRESPPAPLVVEYTVKQRVDGVPVVQAEKFNAFYPMVRHDNVCGRFARSDAPSMAIMTVSQEDAEQHVAPQLSEPIEGQTSGVAEPIAEPSAD